MTAAAAVAFAAAEPVVPALLALAEALADASAQVIRQYFRAPLAVSDKADLSPVTAADRGAELAIRALLARHRPEDGVWGEEFGCERPDAEYVWVIDPIDGTKAFITGRPIFATCIALLWRGEPVLGLINQPITGDRWLGAAGHPTTLNGQPARVRACPVLAQAVLGTTGPDLFAPEDGAAFQRVATGARFTVWGGDAYAYGLVAAGFQDLVIESGLKLHDFAALAPVILGAGGVMTDWQGHPLRADSDGRVIAAGDARVHAEAQALL